MQARALFLCAVFATACTIPVPPKDAFPTDAADAGADAAVDALDAEDAGTDTVLGDLAVFDVDSADLDTKIDSTAGDGASLDAEETSLDAEAGSSDAVEDSADADTGSSDANEDTLDAEVASSDVEADVSDTFDAEMDAPDVDLCAGVACEELPCATQKCDSATGKCVASSKVDGWACDDGKKCTENDACLGGVCTGATKSCDDGNACTNDSCNASMGCVNAVVKAGTTCDDGNACTVGDVCVSMTCAGSEGLWTQTVGTPGDVFYAVLPVSDGTIAVGAKYETVTPKPFHPDLWVRKTDVKGNELWSFTYGKPGSGTARSVVAVADGYVIAGQNMSEIVNVYQGWLLKIDLSGKQVWSTLLPGNGQLGLADVVVDGTGFVAIGGTADVAGTNLRAWIVRVDAAGKVSWSHALTAAVDQYFTAMSSTSGGFIAVGRSGASPNTDGLVVRLDSDGNTVWQRTYGGPLLDLLLDVLDTPDGFVLAGERKPTDADPGDNWLLRTDADGNVLWERTWGTATENRLLSVVPLGDGFLATGDNWDANGVAHTSLMRLDGWGTAISTVGLAGGSVGKVALEQNRLWIAGTGSTGAWLQTTDLWGNATCAASGPCAGFTNDCDDGNACSADLCGQGTAGCWWKDLANGSDCSDGQACIAAQTCNAGSCGGGDKLFDKVITTNGGNSAVAAVTTGGGGFTVTATTKGAYPGNARLLHTDATGAVLWDKTFSLGSYAGQVAAVVNAGAGYAVAGSVASDSNQENPFLLVTDALGTQTVFAELGTSADEWVNGLVAVNDGYVLAGLTRSNGTATPDAMLIKTSLTGDQQWQKTWNGGGKARVAHRVAAIPGGCVVAGTIATPGSAEKIWLARTDEAGNGVWEQALDTLNAGSVVPLAVQADGFAVGTATGIASMSLDGTLLWARGYAGVLAPTALLALPNGLLLTGGAIPSFQMRTDVDGNQLWTHQTAAADASAIALMDGFAFSSIVNGNVRLARTDLWGNATCAASGTCVGLNLSDCDDSNPCTADICDFSQNGCFHTDMADGTACGYGAVCSSGACTCSPGYVSTPSGAGTVCAADIPVWGASPLSLASLTDIGGGMVADDATGLTWQQPSPANDKANWNDAVLKCVALNLGGQTDWRLPTLAELNTLIDFTKSNPATSNLLQTNVTLAYWSATPLANGTGNAWSVSFVIGTQQPAQMTTMNHVRCVRGTTATPPKPRFTAANGIVIDAWTGLKWQQDFSPAIPSPAGPTYCGALLVNGETDWRVPTIVELRTIIDRTVSGPAINSTIFPNTPSDWFWATPGAGGSTSEIWSVYFSEGKSEGSTNTNSFRVRCVK